MEEYECIKPDITDLCIDDLVKIGGEDAEIIKSRKGTYLRHNTLKLEDVYKKGMVKQKNKDSSFVLWADPRIAKLLDGLCWCCGRPRILINFGRNGWQETCVHSARMKPCKYSHCNKSKCVAKGRTDGNCKGKCPDARR